MLVFEDNLLYFVDIHLFEFNMSIWLLYDI